MELLILGSLLLTGGLLSLAGVFDGDDDKDDSPPDDAHRGTEGDDTLSGDEGVLHGLRGDDQITVSGTAEAYGDKGDDRLTVSGTATAFGGEGNDIISAQDQSTGDGGSGDDTISAYDSATAEGGVGRDRISVSDTALGYGGSGDDNVGIWDATTGYGGDGADFINIHNDGIGYGGAGNDDLVVQANGTAYGEAGDDDLRGSGQSHIFGGDGNDDIRNYGAAESSLFGGNGEDHIRASAGFVDAGAGNDILELNWPSIGFDGMGVARPNLTVTGGEGGDTFLAHADYARDDETFVITDFDPTQDDLSLGISEAQQAHATITTTSFADYTEVTVTLPDMQVVVEGNTLQTVPQVLHLRLNGVTDASLVQYDIQTSPDRS